MFNYEHENFLQRNNKDSINRHLSKKNFRFDLIQRKTVEISFRNKLHYSRSKSSSETSNRTLTTSMTPRTHSVNDSKSSQNALVRHKLMRTINHFYLLLFPHT